MNSQSGTLINETRTSSGETVMQDAQSEFILKSPLPQTRLESVLILDANTRCALAATRSLGKKGVRVVVAGETKRTLSGASKYCSEGFVYPSPAGDLEGFLATIKAESSRRGIEVIFPMTEISVSTVLRHQEQFEPLKLPFGDLKTFDSLTDKWRLLKLAQRLHISIPKTHFVGEISSLGAICSELKFPVVLKPYRSRIWSGGRWISTSVHYAGSVEELKEIAAQHEYFNQHPFLIQEYISGQGQGVFALCDHGKPIVFFAHRRLRERPPSGGVSVLSESIEPNPEAHRMARAILEYVGWHGVAMVEFKVSAEGTPYLMEVNGRFWGSLQLAIDAGVDFPWLLYQLTTGKVVDRADGYTTGVRCRWLLGDLASLCRVLVSNGSSPLLPRFGKVRSVLQFLNFFEKASRYEVNRWDDVKPFLFEVAQYVMALRS